MHIEQLSLCQFRNYDALTLQLSPHVNLFIGKNGQGKTNLLEAVYLLSHTHSYRTRQERELIQHQAPFATIGATVLSKEHQQQQLQIQLAIDPNTERLKTIFKKNGLPVKARSKFLGALPTVSFFVSDLLLLRGSPEDRRHWLDAAVTQFDNRHLGYFQAYQKIKTQKARLLKEDPGQINLDHLSVWNDQLCIAAAKLTSSRLQYLSRIENQVMINYAELSNAQEPLNLAYQLKGLESDLADTILLMSEPELSAFYQEQLKKRQADEIRRGQCLVGPHRDDILFYLGGQSAQSYGSQGQQRTIVLALKLAELNCLQQVLGEAPILLLDDVMAELDQSRQRYLTEHLDPNSQVLMTTTHLDTAWHHQVLDRVSSSSSDLKIATHSVFEVSNGHLNSYQSERLISDSTGQSDVAQTNIVSVTS